MQIISIDDHHETMQISGYLNTYWKDEGMIWEPAEHDEISLLIVSVNQSILLAFKLINYLRKTCFD